MRPVVLRCASDRGAPLTPPLPIHPANRFVDPLQPVHQPCIRFRAADGLAPEQARRDLDRRQRAAKVVRDRGEKRLLLLLERLALGHVGKDRHTEWQSAVPAPDGRRSLPLRWGLPGAVRGTDAALRAWHSYRVARVTCAASFSPCMSWGSARTLGECARLKLIKMRHRHLYFGAIDPKDKLLVAARRVFTPHSQADGVLLPTKWKKLQVAGVDGRHLWDGETVAGYAAAASYTWCSPPRTGRARIAWSAGVGPARERACGRGVSRRSVRCGRSSL